MDVFTTPLDDSLYIATGPTLWVYDHFFCLRQLSPAAPCPAPFVALDFVPGSPGTLLAATAQNIFELVAPDVAQPTCGSPLLPASASRAITAVRGTPARGVYFTEGGSVWATPPLASPRPLLPRLLVGNGVGGDLIIGTRAGLALWGERYLYYAAVGASGWPGEGAPATFRGVLRAGLDGAAPALFFRYASTGDVLHWTPGRLAAAGGDVAWSELRSVPGKPPPQFAVQRTALGGNASVTVATSWLCEGADLGAVSLAGDGAGGGVLWTACGRALAAFPAGPTRAPPLVQLDFAAAPPGSAAGAAPPVTALAFAPGSALCGYRFSYAQPSDGALLCAPRPRVPPGLHCAIAAPLLAAAKALPGWAVALCVAAALLLVAGAAWAAARAGLRCAAAARRAAGAAVWALRCCGARRSVEGASLVAPTAASLQLGAVEAGEEGDAQGGGGGGGGGVQGGGCEAAVVEVPERRAAVAPLRLISNRGRGRKLSGGSGPRLLNI